MDSSVQIHRSGSVNVLTLSDATGRNALSLRMRELLLDALNACLADTECRAIVLTGAGGNFCAGGDVREMNIHSQDEALQRLRLVHRIIRQIVLGAKPVVCAIDGIAAGGGISLLAGCDHVVASDTARLTSSFLRTGVLPDMGALWTVSHRMGLAQARTFFTMGTTLRADQAQQAGLVDTVVATDELMPQSIHIAHQLAQIAPLTFRAFKQALANDAWSFASALAVEEQFQPSLVTSSDHREAVAAFLQKRQPRFTGS